MKLTHEVVVPLAVECEVKGDPGCHPLRFRGDEWQSTLYVEWSADSIWQFTHLEMLAGKEFAREVRQEFEDEAKRKAVEEVRDARYTQQRHGFVDIDAI